MKSDTKGRPSDDDRLREAINRLVASVRAGRDGGEEITGLMTLVSQLRDANQNLVVAAVKAQVMQQEAEARNQQQNEFLAMLAHELRNPLAPISAAAQILKIASNDERVVKDAGEIIGRQVNHMTELVDDLLDVSRVTRGLVKLEKEHIDLKLVVSNAIEQARPLIEARNHVFILRMGSEQAFVDADRTRLVQVIVNLLANAAKYTPRGGEIVLKVQANDGQAMLSVTDNGSGIDPALLPHIFDLFTQGERTPDRTLGGLGLGLTLVKSMMALHNGRVEALSEGPGKGSTFNLFLPVLAESVIKSDLRSDKRIVPAAKPLRLMIVDDNVDAARSLASLLESEGHSVVVAEDANRALQEAASFPSQVFILDIGLPDLDGYELARRLRNIPGRSNAVFVALTGYGQAHDRMLAKAAGFDHHCVKPIDLKRLAEILSQVNSDL